MSRNNTARFDRFKGAPWFTPEGKPTPYPVVGGAGGIGSWLTVLLTRAGFDPFLWDDDTVEEHNIGGQLFKVSNIGMPKVDAVNEVVRDLCGTTLSRENDRIDDEVIIQYHAFAAFDNMTARKDMFNQWKEYLDFADDPKEAIFIDGRLEMEQLQIFCVTIDRIEEYHKHLFSDDEVKDAACTMKQTSHSAAMIASHMVGFYTNHLANMYEGENNRIVPFFYEYFIPLNLQT